MKKKERAWHLRGVVGEKEGYCRYKGDTARGRGMTLSFGAVCGRNVEEQKLGPGKSSNVSRA